MRGVASQVDDRAFRERARCSQPADGRLRYTIRSGKLSLHRTLGKPLHRFPPLMRCELRRPAELDASLLGALPAI
jgi:hypothetical protein